MSSSIGPKWAFSGLFWLKLVVYDPSLAGDMLLWHIVQRYGCNILQEVSTIPFKFSILNDALNYICSVFSCFLMSGSGLYVCICLGNQRRKLEGDLDLFAPSLCQLQPSGRVEMLGALKKKLFFSCWQSTFLVSLHYYSKDIKCSESVQTESVCPWVCVTYVFFSV